MTTMGIKPLLAVTLALSVAAAAEENPLKNAKVGDWIAYKMVTQMAGNNMTGETKQTITAKTDETITMEIVVKMLGQEQKHSQTIKLNEKFDNMQLPQGATFKETGSGDETIKVGDKEYKTKWRTGEFSMKQGEFEVKGTSKVWIAPDVPLGGVVKMQQDMTTMGMKMVMEMTGAGTGSK